jgi:predicted RNA binding protein YcfA (HicA-like mRNA interferase family)
MGHIPVLKALEIIKILHKLGFIEIRQTGSHKQFKHEDGRLTTVPIHKGRDISPILLRVISKDIGMSVSDFVSHL